MKIYVAASFGKKKEVLKIYQRLKELRQDISGDWTLHKPISPYEKNQELAKEYSIEDINAVEDCDIFILIADEINSKGKYIELGAAILSNVKFGKPKIYVVGNFNKNSMFYFHPSVKKINFVEEVLKELGNL